MSEAQVGSRRGPYRKKEIHSEDFPVYQPPEIDASDLSVDPSLRGEAIITDPAMVRAVAHKSYMDDLAFAEEIVTIMLYRGQEEFAPPFYSFWVNGKQVNVPVDQPVKLRRKYVEVIARSQPYRLRTVVQKPPEGSNAAIANTWRREATAQYPFTVIEDKNPRGAVWLETIKRGG